MSKYRLKAVSINGGFVSKIEIDEQATQNSIRKRVGEGEAMKRAVALMMMVFLIVARADEMGGVDPFRDSGRRVDGGFGICIPQCAITCILKLRWNPIAYGICFGLCLIGCKNTPSDAVYGCTSTCAYSREFSPQPVTDRSSAEGYVNWCYDNCKKM